MKESTIFWLVLIVGFAIVMPMVQNWIQHKYKQQKGADEARNVLETRYALGEIDDDEFEHRMELLTEQRVAYAKKTVRKGLEV